MTNLADKIEALDGPCRETDVEIALAVGWDIKDGGDPTFSELANRFGSDWALETATEYTSIYRALPTYTASLDAAMTLFKTVPDMVPSCPRKTAAAALRAREAQQ